jgi:hypothetical protein
MAPEKYGQASRRSILILSALGLLFACPGILITLASVTASRAPSSTPEIHVINIVHQVAPPSPLKSAQDAQELQRTIFDVAR